MSAPAADSGAEKKQHAPKSVVSRPPGGGGGFGALNRNNNNNNNSNTAGGRSRTMQDYLQRTLCVSLSDGRLMVGRFVAFDPHLNVVLHHAVEYPAGSNAADAISGKLAKSEQKREVGLVMIRGEHVNGVVALKKKAGAAPTAVNVPGGASAVPGGQLSRTVDLPKASGLRRGRKDDEDD